MRRLASCATTVVLTLGLHAAADWPDPDGDGYTEHTCGDTTGFCPATTPVLACGWDDQPAYRNETPCLTRDGRRSGHGETCTCDHVDGCYSDCLVRPAAPGDGQTGAGPTPADPEPEPEPAPDQMMALRRTWEYAL